VPEVRGAVDRDALKGAAGFTADLQIAVDVPPSNQLAGAPTTPISLLADLDRQGAAERVLTGNPARGRSSALHADLKRGSAERKA
jgi:hypothetical protein